MPSRRDRALQRRIRRHRRGSLWVEPGIIRGIARHRLHQLRHLRVERETTCAEALELIARRAAEPAGNVDLFSRAEQIDQQIVAALLEPQIFICDAGGKGSRAVRGRTAAVVDDILSEIRTKLVGADPCPRVIDGSAAAVEINSVIVVEIDGVARARLRDRIVTSVDVCIIIVAREISRAGRAAQIGIIAGAVDGDGVIASSGQRRGPFAGAVEVDVGVVVAIDVDDAAAAGFRGGVAAAVKIDVIVAAGRIGRARAAIEVGYVAAAAKVDGAAGVACDRRSRIAGAGAVQVDDVVARVLDKGSVPRARCRGGVVTVVESFC
jgi:hypothetical protein